MQPGWAEPPVPSRPFGGTGPQGHRGRMRARLLSAGPDGLADYELVEMLLFLGVPRRDTKPFAKALINRFGDLLHTLSAPPPALSDAGLNDDSLRVWGLVQEAGARLARAETISRPLLNTPERLLDYLDVPRRIARPAHLAALFLNNRNQLLADEAWPGEAAQADTVQHLARRAVHLHATAIVLVRSRPDARPGCLPEDKDLIRDCRRAGKALSLVLHDHLVIGKGEPFSFREFQLL
jgi:DNA repair protein RadC